MRALTGLAHFFDSEVGGSAQGAPELIDDALAIAAAGLEGDHSPYFFSAYGNKYGRYML